MDPSATKKGALSKALTIRLILLYFNILICIKTNERNHLGIDVNSKNIQKFGKQVNYLLFRDIKIEIALHGLA